MERICSVNKRSEEHTSELQSPYVISYAVFCLKKPPRQCGTPMAPHARPHFRTTPRTRQRRHGRSAAQRRAGGGPGVCRCRRHFIFFLKKGGPRNLPPFPPPAFLQR